MPKSPLSRTFAIFPGAWGFFEDTLKNWGMEDEAREAVGFKDQPSTNDSVDSVYYLLAATLMCEFVLETVRVYVSDLRCR